MDTNNKLIIKSKNDVLSLYSSQEGNHARSRTNQRQIDMLRHEILPSIDKKLYKTIGIIAPYKDQVKKIKNDMMTSSDFKYEIDTVHKFQGREQDVIIISSVDNNITQFVDNPKMLNVAVSRAVSSLKIIVSDQIMQVKNSKSNYSDLIRYIKYNQGTITKSKVRSIFDLLYKEYAAQKYKYLKNYKGDLKFDSERILAVLLQSILETDEFDCYDYTPHVELKTIFEDLSLLTNEENYFVTKTDSHVDFMVIYKQDHKPVLAIEVDGWAFHENKEEQLKRDKIKDNIFNKCGIDILRLSTTGSGEKDKIEEALKIKIKNKLKQIDTDDYEEDVYKEEDLFE